MSKMRSNSTWSALSAEQRDARWRRVACLKRPGFPVVPGYSRLYSFFFEGGGGNAECRMSNVESMLKCPKS